MSKALDYPDLVSFYKTEATGYRGNKISLAESNVAAFFLQNTGFTQDNLQEGITSDAVCYPDPDNSFVKEYGNRLEGMYILVTIFDDDTQNSWYKVISVTVNRDHLLKNEIDNIELQLKKSAGIEEGEIS